MKEKMKAQMKAKILYKRITLFITAVAIQVLFFLIVYTLLEPFANLINLILAIYSLGFVIYFVSKQEEATYRILWLSLILIFPTGGTLLYLMTGNKRSGKKIMIKINESEAKLPDLLEEKKDNTVKIPEKYARLKKTFEMIERETGYPACENENVRYYPIGEELFAKMKEELKKAKHFIYCEYFIISFGKMKDELEEILAHKAAEGVDVRIMYDDFGSLGTFSPEEVERLEELNIKCLCFNPIRYLIGTINYRDHKKMLIIDGVSAFSGGINIADEYINEIRRFGHWKDNGFWLTGPAVKNYTHMFVKFWNAFSEDRIEYKIYEDAARTEYQGSDGMVLSYYDSPVIESNISNDLYIDLFYQAKDYIWFYTPYLIPGSALLDAIINAAKRGVDIRIIIPGVPDKKMVFYMTKSYYEQLMNVGVKIYEYTPGFLHAKGCVMDDYLAVVGTVNMDYRSLFLHYENNSVFVGSHIAHDLKKDMIATMEKCKEQKLKEIRKNFFGYLIDGVLRIFAPLC